MNLFKNLFSKGKKSNKSNDAIVNSIRKSKEFRDGKRCFHYANFGFFYICDEKESAYYKDMNCFALDNVNADWEERGCIYYTKDTGEVFYKSFMKADYRLVKIANSLNELFGEININEILVTRDDDSYYLWVEENFHSYNIIEYVPKCVVPNIDLRTYLSEKHSYFLSHYEDFSNKTFIEYLTRKEKHIADLVPSNFYFRHAKEEKVIDLIAEINSKSKKSHFEIIEFLPSCFLGIIDMNDLSKEDANELIRLGLIFPPK
ncbi:MAG: hypothetical protein ACTTJI_06365 [Capnocytophaga sp.]|uniref:hypothetical protein n=1 Tax=Capnocytophaga TaxID=1016 RepID=UPI0028EA1289|nr:hypothetical protein [Capnocytophaga leadbetteri]